MTTDKHAEPQNLEGKFFDELVNHTSLSADERFSLLNLAIHLYDFEDTWDKDGLSWDLQQWADYIVLLAKKGVSYADIVRHCRGGRRIIPFLDHQKKMLGE